MSNLPGSDLLAEAKSKAKQLKKDNKEMKPKFTDKQISLKSIIIAFVALVLGLVSGYYINDVVNTYAEAKAQSLVTSLSAPAAPSKQ